MEVIPSTLETTGSEIETKKLLERIDMPEARAFWSMHLPEHEYKPWAEADFVIVMKNSILVLEVKGSRNISRDDQGIWRYIDHNKKPIVRSESPIEQVSSASVAIRKRLISNILN